MKPIRKLFFPIFMIGCTLVSASTQSASPSKNANQAETEKRAIDILKRYFHDNSIEPSGEIKTLHSEFIEWSDASLGCPDPGFNYPQVITPGYKVKLAAGENTYFVHLSEKQGKVCKHRALTNEKSGGVKPDKLRIISLIENAKIDLSEKINLPKEKIKLVSSTPVTWNNNALGCPTPGENYEQKAVKGFVIKLEGEKRFYTYHTDSINRLIPCPNIAAN